MLVRFLVHDSNGLVQREPNDGCLLFIICLAVNTVGMQSLSRGVIELGSTHESCLERKESTDTVACDWPLVL